MKQRFFYWFRWVLIVYASIGIILYYVQDYFLFHPVPLQKTYRYQTKEAYEEFFLPVNKTDTLCVVRFKSRLDTVKGAVLYFHGNKRHVEHYAPFVQQFTQKGYEVWMPDYPGFGKTTGTRTEQKLYSQGWQAYQLMKSRFSPQQIFIYGKSLGTGIASYLASGNDCRALVLETPYYSIPAMFQRFAPIYPAARMAHYQLPVYEYLPLVQQPITLIYGTDDGLIPERQVERLLHLLKKNDRVVKIEGGTHHNLAGFQEYRQVIDQLLP